MHQRAQLEVRAGAPEVLDHVGQEDVLTALYGIGGHADQREQSRDRALDALPHRFVVLPRRRRGQALEDG